MIKNDFQKEILFPNTLKRSGMNNAKEVKKLQSWLTLFEMANKGSGTALNIDGLFGPATETAVKKYQQIMTLPQTGIVDNSLFQRLISPLIAAFTIPSDEVLLRDKIVKLAFNHLKQEPFELTIGKNSNSGPWVRSYMDGKEGEDQLWCLGFTQTIIDQAASEIAKDFRKIMPKSNFCDDLGNDGIRTGRLTKNNIWKLNPNIAKPGDIFLLYDPNPAILWHHVGIIIKANHEIIETIEGNSNTDGSDNGYGVFNRIRNFHTSNLDLFTIDDLV